MTSFYGRDGEPISIEDWSRLYESSYGDGRFEATRLVARDTIGLFVVSTVWIGIDLGASFVFGGPPLIFETMVFLSGTPEDLDMHRYATEVQARAGHEIVCAEIREREASMTTPDGEDGPDALITRRTWLTILAVAEGADVFAAAEAVSTTALAHPEWDMNELRRGSVWAASEDATP